MLFLAHVTQHRVLVHKIIDWFGVEGAFSLDKFKAKQQTPSQMKDNHTASSEVLHQTSLPFSSEDQGSNKSQKQLIRHP